MARPGPRSLATIYGDIMRRLYVDESHSLRQVALILKTSYSLRVSPIRIKQILNARGVDTRKSSPSGCRRLVVCRNCGTPFEIARSRYVESRGHGASPLGRGGTSSPHRPRFHYCSWACRVVYLEEHGRAQEAARRLVEYVLGTPLPPDAVCHFIDGDTRNITKRNIRVFTSTKRHIEEHRKEE